MGGKVISRYNDANDVKEHRKALRSLLRIRSRKEIDNSELLKQQSILVHKSDTIRKVMQECRLSGFSSGNQTLLTFDQKSLSRV